jgi:hypothetical protein
MDPMLKGILQSELINSLPKDRIFDIRQNVQGVRSYQKISKAQEFYWNSMLILATSSLGAVTFIQNFSPTGEMRVVPIQQIEEATGIPVSENQAAMMAILGLSAAGKKSSTRRMVLPNKDK